MKQFEFKLKIENVLKDEKLSQGEMISKIYRIINQAGSELISDFHVGAN